MIEQCRGQQWVEQLKDYIGSDYPKLPYFYCNLCRYGNDASNINVKLWVDIQDGIINGAYLLYYDCLHFITKNTDYPIKSFLSMKEELNPKVLMVQGTFAQRVADTIKEQYTAEYNHVIKLLFKQEGNHTGHVELARYEDLEAISDTLIQDSEYHAVYDKTVLLSQLRSRFTDGYGRCFVIRDGGTIACAYCIYGETDNLAMLGGLITHPDYRRRGYSSQITNYALELLHQEGKVCVGFVNIHNEPSLKFHKKLGVKMIGLLCKFVRIA